jgi:hypothetical protein
MGLTRILQTSSATLTRTFYVDEEPTDSIEQVTVTVQRLDGTVVTGPANAAGPTAPDSGTYRYVLPGGSDPLISATYQLDDLNVYWTAALGGAQVTVVDRVEVVGGFFFTIAEGRASDMSLSSTTTYPTAALIRARLDVERECELICKQSFVPRFRRVTLDGSGYTELLLPDPFVRLVRYVSITDSEGYIEELWAEDLSYVNASHGSVLVRSDGGVWPYGTQNIVVEYEHGRDFAPPELVDASLMRFRSLLNRNRAGVPDRAERIVNDQGNTYLLSMPGEHKTGIPEVDAAYVRASRGQLPGLA